MGRDGDGVTVRETSIRVSFTWKGVHRRETVTMKGVVLAPTPANVMMARRLARDVRARIQAGTFDYAEFFPDSAHAPAAAGMTFGHACDKGMKAKGMLATKTKAQYRNALEVWKGMFGADTAIASIRHGTIAAKIGSHPWASAKLLNNYLICLRGAFALAGRDIELGDPLAGVENAKHQKVEPDPLTNAEREAILADLRKHYTTPVWAYFEFAFFTGMRPEEMIALRWSDIDWGQLTARVERARTAGEVGPLKTYQARDVELSERAIAALQSMKAHTFLADGDVFINPVTRKSWHDERSQRDHYWKPALRRCGIRYRRAYQTRHTYATSALMGGVNPSYIARQMGHRSPRMLFSVYAKWIDLADRGRERAKLDAALGGAPVAQQQGEP